MERRGYAPQESEPSALVRHYIERYKIYETNREQFVRENGDVVTVGDLDFNLGDEVLIVRGKENDVDGGWIIFSWDNDQLYLYKMEEGQFKFKTRTFHEFLAERQLVQEGIVKKARALSSGTTMNMPAMKVPVPKPKAPQPVEILHEDDLVPRKIVSRAGPESENEMHEAEDFLQRKKNGVAITPEERAQYKEREADFIEKTRLFAPDIHKNAAEFKRSPGVWVKRNNGTWENNWKIYDYTIDKNDRPDTVTLYRKKDQLDPDGTQGYHFKENVPYAVFLEWQKEGNNT